MCCTCKPDRGGIHTNDLILLPSQKYYPNMYIYIAHHIYIYLKVHWTKGQKKLHETDRKIFTKKAGRNTLHIRNVQPSDFGNYSCRADNDLGKARTYTSLSGK